MHKSFRGWHASGPLAVTRVASASHDGVELQIHEFESQLSFPRLRLYVLSRTERDKLRPVELNVLNILDDQALEEFLASVRPAFEAQLKDELLPPADEAGWQDLKKMLEQFPWVMTYVAPSGIGLTSWDQSDRKQVQNRRRFYLLGQSLDSYHAFDVRRAIQATRMIDALARTPLWLQSQRNMAGVTLYASLFEPDIKRLDLYDLPKSHREGPIFLNVQRYLDMPQAVALAAERAKVVIYQDDDTGWDYPRAVAERLGWDAKQLQIRRKPK